MVGVLNVLTEIRDLHLTVLQNFTVLEKSD